MRYRRSPHGISVSLTLRANKSSPPRQIPVGRVIGELRASTRGGNAREFIFESFAIVPGERLPGITKNRPNNFPLFLSPRSHPGLKPIRTRNLAITRTDVNPNNRMKQISMFTKVLFVIETRCWIFVTDNHNFSRAFMISLPWSPSVRF